MDIDMLELLLDDNKTYQEATKETFLKQLNKDVFEEFKENGDTQLEIHYGTCGNEKCNKGCKGVRFVSPITKNHSAFIFEGDEDEVKDIYYCSNFNCSYPHYELFYSFPIYIGKDQEANFKPSIEHLLKVQQSDRAYNEIVNEENKILSKEDCLYWLEKHIELHKMLPPFYSDYKDFYNFQFLYDSLTELTACFNYEQEVLLALDKFSTIDCCNEEDLLIWLTNFEALNDKIFSSYFSYLHIEEAPVRELINLSKKINLKISVADYKNIIEFCKKFDYYYYPLVEKYYTYANDEEFNDDDFASYSQKLSSLSYHLLRRNEAALIGKKYPFFMREKISNNH